MDTIRVDRGPSPAQSAWAPAPELPPRQHGPKRRARSRMSRDWLRTVGLARACLWLSILLARAPT
eukprot:1403480-Alexandrium_andersonii.AAC.1